MERHIGLDAHTQTCTLCVMGPSGRRLGEYVVETSPKTLVERVRIIAGDRYIVMEEGTQCERLCEVLEPHAKRVLVTQPLERAGNKNDAIDAWQLAGLLRRDALERTVFKSPHTFTRCARPRVGTSPRAATWCDRNSGCTPCTDRAACSRPRRSTTRLSESHRTAEKWLLEEAERLPIARRLATAPGIGPIRAALLVAIVVTPSRLRTTRQFWSYCGLAIVTRSSSDWVRDSHGGWARKPVAQTRGLNRNRQPELKAIFKGAATTIIHLMPKHPLHGDFQRSLEAGIKPNLAKLTLARRIAAMVLTMWKHQEDYDPSKHATRKPPSQ